MSEQSAFRNTSPGFLANQMARLFAQALAERLKPLRIAPAQFMVLLELWTGDQLTQRDLVERLDVEQATMASTLMRMERDGLIERRPNARDSRSRTIHVTEQAFALREPAIAAAKSVNALALATLSDTETANLLDMVRAVIAALQSRESLAHERPAPGKAKGGHVGRRLGGARAAEA